MMSLLLLFIGWIGWIGAPADSLSEAAASVQEHAQTILAERFPGEGNHLKVRVLRTSRSVDPSAPARVTFPSLDRVPRGRTQVRVQTRSETTGWQDAGWAQLHVAHYDSVMMIRRTLSADDEITSDDVYATWMETTRFRGEPMRASDFESLHAEHPLFARRRLSEGRALRENDVRPPYAATMGARVEMRYIRRGVLLRVQCKARESGFVGEAIRLYASDTDVTYRARLTGPGTAEWIETL